MTGHQISMVVLIIEYNVFSTLPDQLFPMLFRVSIEALWAVQRQRRKLLSIAWHKGTNHRQLLNLGIYIPGAVW